MAVIKVGEVDNEYFKQKKKNSMSKAIDMKSIQNIQGLSYSSTRLQQGAGGAMGNDSMKRDLNVKLRTVDLILKVMESFQSFVNGKVA